MLRRSTFLFFLTLVVFPFYAYGIVGGQKYNQPDINSQILYLDIRLNDNSIVCTAVAISPTHAITAAHCFNHLWEDKCFTNQTQKPTFNKKCQVKIFDKNHPLRKVKISLHQNYSPLIVQTKNYLEKTNFDIAILTFQKKQFNEYYEIQLKKTKVRVPLMFLGFGMSQLQTNKRGKEIQLIQKYRGHLKFMHLRKFVRRDGLFINNPSTKSSLLTQQEDRTLVEGQILRSDSGGPLLYKNKVIGLARNFTISEKSFEASSERMIGTQSKKITIQSYFTDLSEDKVHEFLVKKIAGNNDITSHDFTVE